ncbi:PIN domain-containing protein, partial [Klebsiella aerogenes]|uniref:PIN domain-containing protein n=1 Tax=Klebsiella aerogenes TaxID=548 RepID=UPI001953E9C2
ELWSSIALGMGSGMIFLDTSFLIAYLNKLDDNHEKACKIIKGIKSYGTVVISDYILDELLE